MAANDEQKPPAEPTDDLVRSRHSITVAGRTLDYTATTGRIVLRQEVHTDGKFDGNKARAEVFVTAYTLDDTDPAAGDLRVQRWAGFCQRVAAPGTARAAPGRQRRRRRADPAAVRAGGQRRDAARRQ
jgi:hypothetical protein